MPKPVSKFSGLFAGHDVPEPQAAGRTEQVEVADIRPKMGRPAGKRSNPAFKPRTVLMRDQTHAEATDILRHQKQGRDLSDLVNSLLEQWVRDQHAS